ncbi:hypothetical protein L2E82_20698 [Cichorium intybus]|uniref:Uncharacterized protein n=1 Tax=Cichorium intybus TaxID=13427 RepID=A0ACB9DTR1_CICIN|nr:hypothetical protein L2E82_20698 [Cichorium intybus]
MFAPPNGVNQWLGIDLPDCPGTESKDAGKSDACAGCPNQEACATAPKGPDLDLVAITERIAMVNHKILVLSGKGDVGKSTFSAQPIQNSREFPRFKSIQNPSHKLFKVDLIFQIIRHLLESSFWCFNGGD